MKEGKVADVVANMATNLGNSVPESIENSPILDMFELAYLEAYRDLDTERNHSMGLMRIPWSSIQRWVEVYRLDYVSAFSVHYVIRTVDNQMLTDYAKST